MHVLLGRKMLSELTEKYRKETGSDISPKDLRILEDMLLADDLFDTVKKYAS